VWKLEITDHVWADTGVLNSCKLKIIGI